MIFVGDDWAEDHHDVYLMDADGERLASGGCPKDFRASPGSTSSSPAMSTIPARWSSGSKPIAACGWRRWSRPGYRVYRGQPAGGRPLSGPSRVSGAKSDAGDAKMLADLVRTDRHNHRPIAGDSDDAEAIKVLARAHQNLIWDRTRHTNGCAARCASTTRPPWWPSRTWPMATPWRCWAGHPAPSRAPT